MTAPRAWPWLRNLLAAAALAGLAYLLWKSWDHQAVLAWMRGANPFLFLAALAILPAFGMPMTPLFIIAGATFGAGVGLVVVWGGLALNLALCYWIARSGLRRWIESLLRRTSYDLPDFTSEGTNPMRFTVTVKLTPGVPAFLKHYVLGIAGVPFAVYLGVSMLITGLYGALFVVLGESLLEHDLTRTLGAAAAMLALGGGLWWWRARKARRALSA